MANKVMVWVLAGAGLALASGGAWWLQQPGKGPAAEKPGATPASSGPAGAAGGPYRLKLSLVDSKPVFDIEGPDFSRAHGLSLSPLLTARGFRDYFDQHSQNVADLALIDQWVLGERRTLDLADGDAAESAVSQAFALAGRIDVIVNNAGYGLLGAICVAELGASLPRSGGWTVYARRAFGDGAGFVVAIAGDIMTMPGLPKVPAAEAIDVDDNGRITGLF